MTKIRKKKQPQEVDGHVMAAFEIIDSHFPERYVPQVQEKLKELGFSIASAGTIRNIKARGPLECHNIPVLTAMLEVALQNRKAKESLVHLLSNVNCCQDA